MPPNRPSWINTVREQLRQLRGDTPGWGYRMSGPPYTEPTVLGCLALLATRTESPGLDASGLIEASARWMERIQSEDGAVGVSADLPTPRWPTALAALLWTRRAAFEHPLRRAVAWLLDRQGYTFVKKPDCALGHDTTIPGWPWVAGTSPWLEPTSFAILALCKRGLARHQRVRDGVRMILDRAVASGGWNMGNSAVFGQPLRPQGRSTGLALLALRAAGQPESLRVTKACHYLSRLLPTTRSPETLGWGLLGLQAWRPLPSSAAAWLEESFEHSPAIAVSPQRQALLLLASSSETLPILGVNALAPSAPLHGTYKS